MIIDDTYVCGCGYGDGPQHPLGEGNCCRKLATGSLIPTNFRKDYPYEGAPEKFDMCDVNGYSITVYTLKNQRMYRQYSDGNWSLPKDESSTNSLTGDW